MRNAQSRTWNMERNWKTWNMRNTHCKTENVGRNTGRNMKKKKCQLQDLDNSLKPEKREKGDTYMGEPVMWQEN